jgi:hypothetical protein
VGRIFSARKTRVFFRPGPARPVKRSSINEAIDEDELLNYYNLSLFHKKAVLVSFVKFFERMIIH